METKKFNRIKWSAPAPCPVKNAGDVQCAKPNLHGDSHQFCLYQPHEGNCIRLCFQHPEERP